VAPQAFQECGVTPNYAETFRMARLMHALEGEQLYDHKTTPARRALGLEGLNPARASERVHPDKKSEIVVFNAATMAGCIPQDGKKRSIVDPATRMALAAAAGLRSRSSIQRHLRRSKLLQSKRKKYACASHLHTVLPEGKNPRYSKEDYALPKLEDLRSASLPVKFDTKSKANGYYHVPGWMADQRWMTHEALRKAGVTAKTAKQVFEYLCSCGLLQLKTLIQGEPPNTKARKGLRYDVAVSQRKIAQALSMHTKTVRRAIRFWELVGVLQVKHYKAYKDEAGNWHQPSCLYIYIADRMLTWEHARQELDRLKHFRKQIQDKSYWRLASEIHRALLDEWTGTERKLHTFWRACSEKMLTAGIPEKIIKVLIPQPPN
jgi:hypothetical protein